MPQGPGEFGKQEPVQQARLDKHLEDPAAMRVGAAGLSVHAPVFVPSPDSVREYSLNSDFTVPSFGVCAVPSIGEQLDYLLSCRMQCQAPAGSNTEELVEEENGKLKEEVASLRSCVETLKDESAALEQKLEDLKLQVVSQVVQGVFGKLPQFITPVVQQCLDYTLHTTLTQTMEAQRQVIVECTVKQLKTELGLQGARPAQQRLRAQLDGGQSGTSVLGVPPLSLEKRGLERRRLVLVSVYALPPR